MSLNIKLTIIIIAIVIAAGASLYISIGNFDDSISLIVDSDKIEKPLLVETKNHQLAQQVVTIAINMYEKSDKDLAALDNSLDMNINSKYKRYGFVIDFETKKIVSHPNPDLIGQDSFALINSSESPESILESLENNEGHWVYYEFTNPATGNIEPKTSWFKLHDGLIFGSGFYN